MTRAGSVTTIPLAPASLAGSCDLPGEPRTGRPRTSPLFGLAPCGVWPATSTCGRARCALTAPFHPYRPLRRGTGTGGMFSVPLSFRSPRPGDYPAHCPAEFGLSSPCAPCEGTRRSSDRLRRNVNDQIGASPLKPPASTRTGPMPCSVSAGSTPCDALAIFRWGLRPQTPRPH